MLDTVKSMRDCGVVAPMLGFCGQMHLVLTTPLKALIVSMR